MGDYYTGAPSFGPLFYRADQKYGFRPGTTGSLAYIESRYNPKAVSPQGAQGLMQLMPDTGRGLGVNNPFDPAQSVDAGARYFKQGLDAEGGDYAKAAMYYHGGPNQSIWGPKTHAYADNFTSRLTSLNQPGGPPQMPPQAPPASLGAFAGMQGLSQPQPQGQAQGPSLGALAQSMPQGNIPAPHHSKFNLANIAGVLGDALSAYGGRQPTFGPFLQQQQAANADFQRQLMLYQGQAQAKMMYPDGEFERELMQQGIAPGSPEWLQAMKTKTANTLDPVVMTPEGPRLRSDITGAGTPAPAGVTFTPIGGN